jgi:hypothetical protein
MLGWLVLIHASTPEERDEAHDKSSHLLVKWELGCPVLIFSTYWCCRAKPRGSFLGDIRNATRQKRAIFLRYLPNALLGRWVRTPISVSTLTGLPPAHRIRYLRSTLGIFRDNSIALVRALCRCRLLCRRGVPQRFCLTKQISFPVPSCHGQPWHRVHQESP